MAEPAITVRARFSDTKAGGNLPIARVVVHATAGGQGYPRESRAGVAHATAQYFTSAAAGGSAHYICDVAGEEHCVPDDVVAYHAPPNGGSIGIEICADPSYTRAQWLAPDVWPAVKRAAARARELLDRYKLPRNRLLPADLLAGHKGVCAHVDVSNAWHQSTHWDTGPNFPWPEFMAEVEAAGPAPAPAPAPAVPPAPSIYVNQEDPMQLPAGQTVHIPVPQVPAGCKAVLVATGDSVSGAVLYSKGVRPDGASVPLLSTGKDWLLWLAPGSRPVADLTGLSAVELVNKGAESNPTALAGAVISVVPA